MAVWWNGGCAQRGAGRWLRAARMAMVAATLALGLVVVTMVPVGGNRGTSSAYACGLETSQTMLANAFPAEVFPVPVGENVPESQPIGVFAQQYAMGQNVTFSEDLSRDLTAPPPGSYHLRWTFGDGSPSVIASSASHTFTKPGKYNVSLEIQDASGPDWNDFDSAQIQVVSTLLPNPPVARITADKTAIAQQGSITFDAGGSHAVVGSHLTYEWNFNDTGTATGPHVTHQFFVTGNTFVTLIVTDDRGARSVATINIGIVNSPEQIPSASLTANDASVAAGQPLLFDASGSTPASQPAGDQIARYDWDFGDGTPVQSTQGATTSHAFQKAGQYRVMVQAVDTQGVPAQAVMAIAVTPAASGASGPGAGGSAWIMLGVLALVVIGGAAGGWYLMRAQGQQTKRERQRQAMMELQRARRVPRRGVRPGDPRWGDPRAGSRAGPRAGSSGPGQSGARNDPRRGPPPRGGGN